MFRGLDIQLAFAFTFMLGMTIAYEIVLVIYNLRLILKELRKK